MLSHFFKSSTISLIILSIASCVAVVGPYIATPEIPGTDVQPDDNILTRFDLGSFRDVRESTPEIKNRISPEGDVTTIVKNAVRKAFEERGATITTFTKLSIHGEIRAWEAETRGTSTGEVKSKASLYIEVHHDGKRIFGGTYHGSRSSQFPIITSQDIGDSLGLAMSQAIEQLATDKSLREVITASY